MVGVSFFSTVTGAEQLGQIPRIVLKYSHTFKAMNAPMGANIKKAMKELNIVKKIPPNGERKNAIIPTKVNAVDVNSFNAAGILLLLLLFPSPPGGKNMDSLDDDDDDDDDDDRILLDGYNDNCFR
jgi:hypothetical protein